VDSALMSVAQAAVAAGRAANSSAWVNEALHRQAAHDRRMQALDQFLDAYEAEHGVITEEEIGVASRRARARSRSCEAAGARSARERNRAAVRELAECSYWTRELSSLSSAPSATSSP
jgi:hypothetical protein